MELLKFINQHENWKELLQKPPYFLDVKEEDGYTLLKYNQINSDFSEPIVKECRGIILDSNNKIVCWPFNKFFNFGETYADEIDWNSARVQEKIDGSIIKIWYDKKWRLSTNGVIDAYKVNLNINELLQTKCSFHTFGELFEAAKNYDAINWESLNPDYTYMFELTSPYNKVVIAYPEIIINHIGTRNNITGEEVDVDIGVRKPKEYPIHILEDCIKAASKLPADQEGYVVVDKYWKRVKIKNPIYLQLHRMISNNQLKTKDILKMIFENEQGEFLSYFPEYKEAFNKITTTLHVLYKKLENTYEVISDYYKTLEQPTQKDFALKVMELDKENSSYYFQKQKSTSFDDWIRRMNIDTLAEKIKKYSEENLTEK